MSEPTVAKKGPYIVDVEAKAYYWCSCGLSANQPFCDGTHKTTEFKPVKTEFDKPQKVAFCGCKNSKNPPFCDGTHSKL